MNKISAFLIIGIWMITSMSCDDNDKWEAGPQVASNNSGVYFAQSNPKIFEMEANENSELVQNYFTISLGRDKTKANSALEVPITVHYADPNLSISKVAYFEAGSAYTELKISMADFSISKLYNFSIEIDANYADPYKVYEDEEDGGSSRLDAQVEVLSLLCTATFTPTDYSGSTVPEFIPFEQKIYDNQDGTYTIKNFLFNNAGYNFTFTIDDEKNINPLISSGYHSISDSRWYFYSANSDADANRIPCYIPGNNVKDYITYIYFYTAENTTSYQDFWIDKITKTGRMMGYARYAVSSSGRIAFNISW